MHRLDDVILNPEENCVVGARAAAALRTFNANGHGRLSHRMKYNMRRHNAPAAYKIIGRSRRQPRAHAGRVKGGENAARKPSALEWRLGLSPGELATAQHEVAYAEAEKVAAKEAERRLKQALYDEGMLG